jgi:hypothetical protein
VEVIAGFPAAWPKLGGGVAVGVGGGTGVGVGGGTGVGVGAGQFTVMDFSQLGKVIGMVLNPTKVAVPEKVRGQGWGGNVLSNGKVLLGSVALKIPFEGAVKVIE